MAVRRRRDEADRPAPYPRDWAGPDGAPPAEAYIVTDAVEDVPPPARPDIAPWLVALLFAAAAIVAAVLAATHWSSGPATRRVPSVLGLAAPQAAAQLRAAGFEVSVDRRVSGRPDGLVLAQRPEPRAGLSKGSHVGLIASSGPPHVKTPQLVGLTAEAATRLAGTLHLAAHPTVVASDRPAGTVLAQNPPPGVEVARNSGLFFSVAKGRTLVAVPPLRGLTEARAVARLRRLGLAPFVRRVTSPLPVGTVVAQEPPRGFKVALGRTVSVNVSRGTGLVAVPPLRGLVLSKALGRLQAARLKASVHRIAAPQPPGVVVAQSPPSQKQVEPGTTVRLNVSKGSHVAVPAVTGLQQSQAVIAIGRAGLVPVVERAPNPKPAGTVLAQSPAAGAQVAPKSQVRIGVSSGPAKK